MHLRKLNPALREELRRYITQHYAPAEADEAADRRPAAEPSEYAIPLPLYAPAPKMGASLKSACRRPAQEDAAAPPDWDSIIVTLDESFQQMLLRKIDEKGMKDSACYKRAGIDRKLFSKIRSNPHYQPKKTTAIAFAMALELDLDEAKELLMKAGYALSHSSLFDVIVEYFILHRRYSVTELNEALYEHDQPLL